MKNKQHPLRIFAIAFLVFPTLLFGQKTLQFTLLFDHDKSVLKPFEQSVLNQILDSIRLEAGNNYSIELKGNTDSTGSLAYNQALSERRCAAVLKYLADRGVPTSRFQQGAFGENQPIAQNTSEQGRQLNRRVELTLRWQPATLTSDINPENIPIATSAAPQEKQSETERFYETLRNTGQEKEQVFTFETSNTKAEVFQTPQGTIISLPPGIFTVPEQTRVIVTVKDYYRIEDIIGQNLNTQLEASNKLLVSGGMVNVEARTEDGTMLKAQKPYTLMMPRENQEELTIYEAIIPEDKSTQMRRFAGSNRTVPFKWKPIADADLNKTAALYDRIDLIQKKQNTLQALYNRLIDTSGCYKMLVYRKYFYHYITLADGKKQRIADSLFVYADRRPKGYHLYGPNYNDDEVSPFCIDIAEWIDSMHVATNLDWQKKFRRMQRAEMKEIYLSFKATKEITYRKNFFSRPSRKTIWSYDLLLENIQKKIAELETDKTANKALAIQYQQKMEQLADDNEALKQIDAAAYYIFETQEMGWINCDYFWEVPKKELVDVRTNLKPSPDITIKLIFKRRKSVMDPNDYNGQVASFSNIPRNEDAVIVAFTVRNGQAYVAMKDLVTSSELVELSFKPLTPEELREKLALLN